MIVAAANEMGTGEFVFYLLVGLGIIVLAVIWILFPIMVWLKLNELHRFLTTTTKSANP